MPSALGSQGEFVCHHSSQYHHSPLRLDHGHDIAAKTYTYEGGRLSGSVLQNLAEHVHGDVPQARDGVRAGAACTSRPSDDLVKRGLAERVVDGARGYGGAGLHERGAEEAVGLAVVVEHVRGDGYRACALAPASRKSDESVSNFRRGSEQRGGVGGGRTS